MIILICSIGVFISSIFVLILALLTRSRDDLLTRDLLDRSMCRDAGEYMTLLYQRHQLGLDKHIPWEKNFSFNPLVKEIKKEKIEVPPFGEVEQKQAKEEIEKEILRQQTEKKYEADVQLQQFERVAQGRDAGGVM